VPFSLLKRLICLLNHPFVIVDAAMNDLIRPTLYEAYHDIRPVVQQPADAPRMIAEIATKMPPPSAVIVGEPTMMQVIDGHKGIASFRTTVTGYTTHSSLADTGVSAVEAAAKLIAKLSSMRAARKAAADPDSPFTPPYTTMTVNVVNGGTQLNIMAGECWFNWDCRAVPGDSAGAARAVRPRRG